MPYLQAGPRRKHRGQHGEPAVALGDGGEPDENRLVGDQDEGEVGGPGLAWGDAGERPPAASD